MKAHDLKAEINKRLNVINGKIIRLKKQLENEEQNTDLEETVADLEVIRDDIIHQYNVINTLKLSADEKLKEMEKKIFASIQSFDKAFNEAGGLFKSSRLKERHHSIDFNNPGRTE
ncbi:hypothetical protein [Maribellus mangrovi]|uniref:hypothetical protein n=1 Tax=Maribellus mangrovi TaxID=3133146 RepID=UPI0030EC6D5D